MIKRWLNVNELCRILERSSGATSVGIGKIQAGTPGNTREIMIGAGGVLNIEIDLTYPETQEEVKFR